MNLIKTWAYRLINVYEEEFSEVFVMWFLSFIYRICMVFGWTVMVAFFVGQYGVMYLPILFALHSFSCMLGSLFFGRIINYFEKANLILYLALIISFLFVITAFVYTVSPEVFLLTCLISVSLFLSQFKIVRSLLAESIFSPNQAARVFPVIESAETLGVLLGGILIALLSAFLSLNKLFLVMVVYMLLCVPTILYFMNKTVLVPYKSLFNIPEKGIVIEKDDAMDWNLIKDQLKNNKFVLYLFGLVLLQFVFFGILEYHFTFVVEEFSKSYHHSGGHDANLAADLGALHAGFAAVVIIFQLFFTSRILKGLGSVGTMFISPIVMIVSALGMLVGYGFPSVVISRLNQEVTHVLHYNAYHTTYYALSHRFRTAVIELLEGVVRPLGNILAMVVLFLINFFFSSNFNLYSSLISIFVLIGVIILTKKFGSQFDMKPIKALQNSDSLSEQMNAIEILESLSDKRFALEFVKDLLEHRVDLDKMVKGRLYRFIGEYGCVEDVYFLMGQYEGSENKFDLLESVNDLFERKIDLFEDKPFSMEYLFSFYEKLVSGKVDRENYSELIIFLTRFYLRTNNIHALMKMCEELLDEDNCLYFVNVMKEKDDLGLLHLFERYMKVDSSKVRMAFLSLLDDYMPKNEVKYIVRSCLVSSDIDSVKYGLLYLIVSNNFELVEFYDALLVEKIKEYPELKLFYGVLKMTKDEVDLYNELKNVDLNLLSQALLELEEWGVSENILNELKKKYEMEIYGIYDELSLETDPEVKIEMLYQLKNCYKFLGLNREYFLLKDLLA